MTLEEVKQALKQGKKVTHRFFFDDEYLQMKGGLICTEEGLRIGPEFWDIRSGPEWQKDWEVIE